MGWPNLVSLSRLVALVVSGGLASLTGIWNSRIAMRGRLNAAVVNSILQKILPCGFDEVFPYAQSKIARRVSRPSGVSKKAAIDAALL